MRPTASTAVILSFPGQTPHIVIYDQEKLNEGKAEEAMIAQAWLDENEVVIPGGWGTSGEWEMDTAEAQPGWGPLLYDVASTGFGVVLVPSNLLSRHALRFWGHQLYHGGRERRIRPLSDRSFEEKYGVTLDELQDRASSNALISLARARHHFRARRKDYRSYL
jgi:hypothetical protein